MTAEFEKLKEICLSCEKCELCKGRRNVVFGVGNPKAKIMFVGEGPGEQEDLKGEPFVGPAGKLLDDMLSIIDLSRQENIYIANIVKCRPPRNREPLPDEAAACMPYLRCQVGMIKPKIIVLLGATAAKYILGDHIRITRDRGVWVEKKGVYFMPTYHPAALLRDESKKRDAWHDLLAVQAKMKELGLKE